MTAIKSTKTAEHDQQPRENGVEGEIREFVRRDGQALRRAPESDSELVAHNISTLLQRPGTLTLEFLAGRRMTYVPPLRLYLVASVVYFLLAAFTPSVSEVRRTTTDEG